ncbi:MAG: DUF1385 domain-containing protein [Ruminococcaceae bacterium]|nr:DUF1385 domain-containing protein [Oscillospiraceae bacterium]
MSTPYYGGKYMKKDKCPPCKKTSIGGQALMEGIMMRGPKKTAMAVRNPEGEIVLEIKQNDSKTPLIAKIPVVRGVYNFAMSMIQGYKCLMRSAEISGLEEAEEEMRREAEAKKAAKAAKKAAKKGISPVAEPVGENHDSPAEQAPVAQEILAEEQAPVTEQAATAVEAPVIEEKKEKKKADGASLTTTLVMILGVVLGLGLAIVLFKFVPTALYDLLIWLIPALKPENVALESLIRSLIEGILKIVIVVGYMAAVSLMKEIRRTFRYHGAEHKSIFCYEAGLELTVENVRKQRRFHPRCGTSFLILMVLVNVFVSFFIEPSFIAIFGDSMKEILGPIHGVLPTLVRTGISLVLLPLVMGIGYELLKLAGRYDNFLTRLISLPGVWLQHITVLEPDDSMIECAIAAIKEVIPEDESDKW